MTSTLLRLGARRLAQELLEEEVTDFLGRERYVRHRGSRPHREYHNKYTACDAACSYAVAQVTTEFSARATARFLTERVLPAYRVAGWPVQRI